MRAFSAVLLLLVLFFGAFFGDLGSVSGQDRYDLGIQGFAWNHSSLSALLIISENESWWSASFVNDTLRAIGQWNDALAAFAGNYSGFSYLSSVTVQWTISDVALPGYDLYVNWTQSSLSNSSDEVGLSKTYVNSDSSIVNCTISLAVQTRQGTTMRGIDMQNIALHELGHGLGLGHCNYTGDLMYSIYSLGVPPEGVSTLDAFGVAKCFSWIQKTASFRPVSKWLNVSSVTLPPEISYLNLPVSAQNQPLQTLFDNPSVQFLLMVFAILAQPFIAVPVLVFILLFIVLATYARRKRRLVKVDS
jgi:hypothetical protein